MSKLPGLKASTERHRPDRGAAADSLVLVAAYKLAVGLLLLVVALDLVSLLHEDLSEVAYQWILRLHADPDNPSVVALLGWVGSVERADLEVYFVVSTGYSLLHLIEGVGLSLRKHWAEYLTVLSTIALIPLEVYELFQNRHLLEVVVLAVNVGVALLLVGRLRRGPSPKATP